MTERADPLIQLIELVAAVPQRDNRGLLRYLLGCGGSVSLSIQQEKILSNAQLLRPITDLDLVMLKLTPQIIDFPDLDVVTPNIFWADMRLNPKFLRDTVYSILLDYLGKTTEIAMVHPAITLVQKASPPNFMHDAPREKDIKDCHRLADFLHDGPISRNVWESIVYKSIASLPERSKERTMKTIKNILSI